VPAFLTRIPPDRHNKNIIIITIIIIIIIINFLTRIPPQAHILTHRNTLGTH